MFFLIVVILSSLGFVYFALQNTAGVTVTLANYRFTDIPLYVITLGSLLTGLFIAWILSTFESIATGFTIRGKNKAITQSQRTIHDLQEKIDRLEEEKAELRAEHDADKPTISERIKHSMTPHPSI